MALTIGCIFATLFIKATTIEWLMNRLRVGDFTKIEKLEAQEARALVHAKALFRLNDFAQKGYVEEPIAEKLKAEHAEQFRLACEECVREMDNDQGSSLADRVLRMYAIGIEKHYLKELYEYGEITEKVYKRIFGKLTIQHEKIEHGTLNANPSQYIDNKDVFEHLANVVRRIFSPESLRVTAEEQYMYYRAQSIIARKVVKEMVQAEEMREVEVFGADAFARAKETYETFRINSQNKMDAVSDAYPAAIRALSERLARRGVLKVEEATLDDLNEKEMITPKIYIALRDEIEKEADKVPDEKAV